MSDLYDRLKTALAHRYEIERELGSGGMATVYQARDLKHKRQVAVKVLRPEVAAAFGADRFIREIEILAQLQHPHILGLFDSGEADGFLYYVMPLVEGESLRDRLDREQQIPLQDALQITSQVLEGLSHAHSMGVIHRDIKPENILLSGDHAMLADFGIARALSPADGERLTKTGIVVGTPAYMSPEQASGSAKVDARSDIYSLASVLYEMLGGEPPHTGPTPQAILARQLTGEVLSLTPLRSSVTPELDAVIKKALAPAPADRYPTAFEFKQALLAPTAIVTPAPCEPIVAPRARPGVRAIATLAALAVVVTGVVIVKNQLSAPPTTSDDRLGVAVFPFRTSGGDADRWSEQLPDLLATAMDGTPGVRVADPWSLWTNLRSDRAARARSPDDTEEATGLAEAAHAGQFVLGSLAAEAGRLNMTVRVYRAGLMEPLQSFALAGSVDSMAALVQQLAVQIITAIWPSDSVPDVPPLDRYSTSSADALKAYLHAKEALRRGQITEAEAAIDTALSLDSTFALALVDAINIKTWAAGMRGEFYYLMPLATRAATYTDSLSERNRLRIQATLASVRTDGRAAAEAATRITQLDSTDLDAWAKLGYFHMVYGWQYGSDERDAAMAFDRALSLDSTQVPVLAARASLALQTDGTDAVEPYLRLLRQTDTTNVLTRGLLLAYQAETLPDSEFDEFAATVADRDPTDWRAVLTALRRDRPDRAEVLLKHLRTLRGPAVPTSAISLAEARLMVAEGRWTEVASRLMRGDYADPGLAPVVMRLTVAAAIAGLSEDTATRSLVDSLAAYIPPDSALILWDERPVWLNGWIVGAYHAMYGDTTITRRWQQVIATFPPGGTSQDYRGALQQDLEARMAARRGDLAPALQAARQAYDLWTIHTENVAEYQPEPAMRFHLAMLLRAAGQPDSAAALLRSLVPPTTWLGFYSARASHELGDLAEERGDFAEAARHYAMALRLWDRGGPEIAGWRSQAREGLSRAAAER